MTRSLFSKQINHLEIIKDSFTLQHQQDYKFDSLKKVLIILQEDNNRSLVSESVIEKVNQIFKAMPSHEKYFVKVNPQNQQKYLSLIEELESIVSIPYQKEAQKFKGYLKKILSILFWTNFCYYFIKDFIPTKYGSFDDIYHNAFIGVNIISVILLIATQIMWQVKKHKMILPRIS
jgi:hypothetical protein